jgi:uncharacterized membrane protein (DUF106 family)
MVFEQITGMVSLILSPLSSFVPVLAVAIFSALLTLLIFGLNRVVTNRKMLKELKEKMENIRESLTQAQKEGNKENIEKFLNEMMKTNSEYMRHSFKALIVSTIILVIFLPWLNAKYSGSVVAYLPFSLPLVGSSLTAIYWYILVAFAVGWVVNKLFGGPY